jgi:peroxiredoxin
MRHLILLTISLLLSITLLQGEAIQSFTLPDINNQEINVTDYLGSDLIIIDFWASWCAPCLRLLPELEKIHSENDEVTLLAISIDNPRSVNRAKSLIRSQRYTFVTLFDTNQEIMKQFQVTTVPHTFLISPSGEILYEHTGYTRGDEEKLKAEITRQLSILSEQQESIPHQEQEELNKER